MFPSQNHRYSWRQLTFLLAMSAKSQRLHDYEILSFQKGFRMAEGWCLDCVWTGNRYCSGSCLKSCNWPDCFTAHRYCKSADLQQLPWYPRKQFNRKSVDGRTGWGHGIEGALHRFPHLISCKQRHLSKGRLLPYLELSWQSSWAIKEESDQSILMANRKCFADEHSSSLIG